MSLKVAPSSVGVRNVQEREKYLKFNPKKTVAQLFHFLIKLFYFCLNWDTFDTCVQVKKIFGVESLNFMEKCFIILVIRIP
jgi:hypothetical protein